MAEPTARRALEVTPASQGSVLNNTKSGSMRLFNITLPAAVGVVANDPNRATEN